MLDADIISNALEELADKQTRFKKAKHLQPFRGLRGVSARDMGPVIRDAWAGGVDLTGDAEALRRLFSTAHEDGIVAMALVAAAMPDAPLLALELAEEWLDVVDDTETADALGWLVLGPSLLSQGSAMGLSSYCLESRGSCRPHAKRALVMACMAALPIEVEGVAAGALRDRMGVRRLAFVEQVIPDVCDVVLDAFWREDHPHVCKAIARLARSWGECEPETVAKFVQARMSFTSILLRRAAEKGIKKGQQR